MNIDEMEAGPELDALIANRIFGIKILSYDEMRTEAERAWKDQPQCVYFRGGFRGYWHYEGKHEFHQEFSYYSRNIIAAWEVVAKLHAAGFEFMVSDDEVYFQTKDFDNTDARFRAGCVMGDFGADCASAICRAALKAVTP